MCVWLRIQEDSSGCCWFDGFKNQMQIVSELKAISQKLHTGRFINIFTKCKNECILPWIGMMFTWYLYLPLKNLEVEIKSNPNIQRLRWNRLTNSTVGRSESNKENTPFLHRYMYMILIRQQNMRFMLDLMTLLYESKLIWGCKKVIESKNTQWELWNGKTISYL